MMTVRMMIEKVYVYVAVLVGDYVACWEARLGSKVWSDNITKMIACLARWFFGQTWSYDICQFSGNEVEANLDNMSIICEE